MTFFAPDHLRSVEPVLVPAERASPHHAARRIVAGVLRAHGWSADRLGDAIGVSGQRVRRMIQECDADRVDPHFPAWVLASPDAPRMLRRALAEGLLAFGDRWSGSPSHERPEDRAATLAEAAGELVTDIVRALRDGRISNEERAGIRGRIGALREQCDRMERALEEREAR